MLPAAASDSRLRAAHVRMLRREDLLLAPQRQKLFKHRSTVLAFIAWCNGVGLQALPLRSDAVCFYIQYRLGDMDVDTSTLSNDAASLSAFHLDISQATGILRANAATQPVVRFQLRSFDKNYKKLNRARRSMALWTVRAMALHCWNQETRMGRFHALVILFTACGFLRKRAATLLQVATTLDGAYDPAASNVSFLTSPTHGPYVRIQVTVDKNVQKGWPRNTFIPGVVLGDVPFLEWLRRYLQYDRLADPSLEERPGYLLAAPAGKYFRSTPYTNTDQLVKRVYSVVLPQESSSGDDAVNGKYLGAYSLRKSLVQALYDHMASSGHHSISTVMGDVVGWLSVKSEVTRHYASLSADDSLQLQLATYRAMHKSHTMQPLAASR